MSRLTDLLARVEAKDSMLARDLRAQVELLSKRREFGLNFEQHVPETVELHGRRVRRGDKVHLRPARGKLKPDTAATWRVAELKGPKAKKVAKLIDVETHEVSERKVE